MKSINIRNKKASFNYELIEKLVAGIVLKGTEIKSIRNGKANLNESFCAFENEELIIKGMNISPYEFGTHVNHEAKADRKLLLNKKELKKWLAKTMIKGYTVVPIRLFITETGFAKVEIALAKGKNIHDKRETIKAKDASRDLQRIKAGKY